METEGTNAAAAPVPDSVLWGADPDTLLQELSNAITTGIRDAADSVLYSFSSKPESPSPEAIQALLNSLLTRIGPLLEKELSFVRQVAKRNTFALPADTNREDLAKALSAAREACDEAQDARVDADIAAVRAEMRNVDMNIRQLEAVRRDVEGQVGMLRGLCDGRVEAGERQLGEVGQCVVEAERNFRGCVSDACREGDGARAGTRTVRNGDEHGPLQTFLPTAGNVLGVEVGAGGEYIRELTGLKTRLQG